MLLKVSKLKKWYLGVYYSCIPQEGDCTMRNKIYKVLSVKVLDKFKLLLTFEDGVKKVYDMTPHLHGIFEVLKDPKIFALAHVDYDTVCWTDQLDIDPEILYDDGIVCQ